MFVTTYVKTKFDIF